MENPTEFSMHNNGLKVEDKDQRDGKRKTVMRRRMMMEEGDINQMADAFINNFRNQLKLEREESFKRFQQIISRGI
ncbi:hypothetical protein MANES_15G106000v8 [Manihot esculenta]|uniref:Uncharacterized protein n=1 Tax=Manihot esculenta TaxID=3983 RepID=A0A2C9UEL6_MANES|nr:hypothetical protein MANES_15G106000v8 [Manihot esculenta]